MTMTYGIIFFKTRSLEEIVQFYTRRIGMEVWLEQSGCTILRFGKMLLGFCQRDAPETEGCITFVVDSRDDVDGFYAKLKAAASTARQAFDCASMYESSLLWRELLGNEFPKADPHDGDDNGPKGGYTPPSKARGVEPSRFA